MRVGVFMRAAAVALVAGVTVSACGTGSQLYVDPQKATATAGEAVTFKATFAEGVGCSSIDRNATDRCEWFVDGAAVPGPAIAVTEPGEHVVTAKLSEPEGVYESSARLIVKGSAAASPSAGGGQVQYSEELADPATLEEIFIAGSGSAVFNGGKPATWKVDRKLRIREFWTYHWNEEKGAPGGTIYLKRPDGSSVAELKVTRTMPGQGGVPNAYWVADIDLELEPGTYVVSDSDPGTWAQNAETGGVGMCWVKVEKQ